MDYRGDPEVYKVLDKLEIPFDYYEHPPVPTVEDAAKYWKDIESAHCKNLFFRNHKGNRHYLVIFKYSRSLKIADLEKRLKQGKLTFASPHRMRRYLSIEPGSVSPFGLIHDKESHVHLFLDINLRRYSRISFHPNDNRASLVIPFDGFEKFLKWSENSYEYLTLYDR